MPELDFSIGPTAGIDFTVDGPMFSVSPTLIRDVVRTELAKLGKTLEQWVKDHGPVDTSVSVESVRSDVFEYGEGDFELVISAQAPQAYWSLEAGRGPGGHPPLDKILGWVSRRQFTSRQQRAVRAVGRIQGKSLRGGFAPITAPWEKGMGKHSGSGFYGAHYMDGLEKKGKSFARKSAFPNRVAQMTAEFSDVRQEDVRAAYQIMFSIALKGTRSKPHVFTRMFGEAQWAVDKALDQIRLGIAEVLSTKGRR